MIDDEDREIDIVVRVSPEGAALIECEFPGGEVLGEIAKLFWLLDMNDWRAGKALAYKPIIPEKKERRDVTRPRLIREPAPAMVSQAKLIGRWRWRDCNEIVEAGDMTDLDLPRGSIAEGQVFRQVHADEVGYKICGGSEEFDFLTPIPAEGFVDLVFSERAYQGRMRPLEVVSIEDPDRRPLTGIGVMVDRGDSIAFRIADPRQGYEAMLRSCYARASSIPELERDYAATRVIEKGSPRSVAMNPDGTFGVEYANTHVQANARTAHEIVQELERALGELADDGHCWSKARRLVVDLEAMTREPKPNK